MSLVPDNSVDKNQLTKNQESTWYIEWSSIISS